MPKFKMTLTAVIATGTLAVATAGCGFSVGGTDTIDNADLEQQLTELLSEDAGVDPAGVSTSCPDDQEVKEGNEFDCVLTAPNGDEVTVKVTLTDDSGGFDAVVPKK